MPKTRAKKRAAAATKTVQPESVTFGYPLNGAQREAVTHGAGPLLIVAGAGTGKTTVITERIAWLILQKNLKPDQVLALTFTEKAAEEMVDRIDRRLPYGYVNLWISTFHSFAERLLRQHAIDVGLDPEFRVLSETESWLLVRRNLDQFNLDYYRPLGNPTKFIQALLRHFSRCKDEAIAPPEYLHYAESLKLNRDDDRFVKKKDEADDAVIEARRITEVAEAYHTYQRLLTENSALDFGDLITKLLELFHTRPNLLKKYQDQFQYVLVDEFQDTNWAQYELIKLLAAPKNNLTVVGDDDQSIYKFRGASVANILEFQKDFTETRKVVLTENYRSKQNILDLAYAFIQQNNPYRLEVQLNGKRKKAGHVAAAPITKKLTAIRPGEGMIEVLASETEADEVRTVLERIGAIRQESKAPWSDFAILVRANDHAKPFVQACERANIPYQFVARRGLFLKPVILDVIAYLRLLDNYHESTALYRVLNWPMFRVPSDDLMTLTEYARRKALSLYQAVRDHRMLQSLAAETHTTLDRLLGLLEGHTQLARDKNASEVTYAVVHDTGLLKSLANNERASEMTRLLNEFFKQILTFERSADDPSVRGFVKYLTLAVESGDSGELGEAPEMAGPDQLTIMTVHSAKGLEYPYVFVVNLVERRFPSTERRDPVEIPTPLVREILPEGDWHLQEERRLMYVACTRARDGLFFSFATEYGGTRKKRPSVFLEGLGLLTKDRPNVSERSTTAQPKLGLPLVLEPAVKATLDRHAEFSFTQLIAYEHCPWQYRFAHVLRVPVRPSHTLSFGKTMHATLCKFFRLVKERAATDQVSLFPSPTTPARLASQGEAGGPTPSLVKEGNQAIAGAVRPKSPLVSFDELLDLYSSSWVDDWYDNARQKEEYRKRGSDSLKQFYDSHNGVFPIPLYLEQSFSVKVEPYTLKGAIDRIDLLTKSDSTSPDPSLNRVQDKPLRKEGGSPGVEIIDYKTGKYKEKLETDDRYQLLIYSLAASDPHVLNLRVEKLTFHFLESNKKNSREPKPRDHADVAAWAKKTIEKIKSGDFTATPSVQTCKFCDFREICDFRMV
ncbi:MAG: UvrD-helicase domain-containing protein [Candidatus Kerfeldbacteria bacterium]|nr:UvrD-helicase domain-containing protein [Candidatus Kerfeldbacteria bacterium]